MSMLDRIEEFLDQDSFLASVILGVAFMALMLLMVTCLLILFTAGR